jgi:ABC-type bacteriocin/lantibiotic exporter with double-glycine peptidase domain
MATVMPGGSESTALAVLELLARANDIPFDPTKAGHAFRQATAEIPPTEPRAARRRLAAAAEALGLQVIPRQLSVREAVTVAAYDGPLAIYSVTDDGSARWFVLAESRGGQGKLVSAGEEQPSHFLRPEEIARQVGATNPDAVLEWQTARPASTLAELATPVGDIHHAPGDDPHHHPQHDAHAHAHHMPPLKRVLTLLNPDRRDIWVVVLFAIGIGVFSLVAPVVAMAVVNLAALQTLGQQVIVLSVALLAALGLAAFLQVLQTITVEYLQQRIFVRVADDLTYRLPRADTTAFDKQHGPELLNRFFDVLTVQKSSATLLLDGVTIVIQILVGLVMLAFYDAALIGFDLVLIACLLFMILVLGRGAVRTAIRESIAKYAVAGWMEEVARHRVAFKLAGGPRYAFERGDQLTRDYLIARQAHFKKVLGQFGFALFLQAFANAGLLAVGGYLVVDGQITLGQLVAAEIVVTLVVATFAKFGKQFESYYDLLAAADKLGHLIDIPLERSTGVPHVPHSGGTRVEVHALGFAYDPHRPPVLDDLDLTLAPGERVALMGPNGSGKTTLVELLFGLRAPAHGRIEVDGLDLRDLKLETFREHTAIVKGMEVFEGSVLANVRMGRDHISLHEVRAALERVGLLERLLDLPQGLNTAMQTSGAPLSLGQVNRLMLARAILGQPRLLVLDETLDHMDADIRETVLPALFGREARWTLLVVTHSEDVAKLCDRVIRLEKPVALTAAH